MPSLSVARKHRLRGASACSRPGCVKSCQGSLCMSRAGWHARPLRHGWCDMCSQLVSFTSGRRASAPHSVGRYCVARSARLDNLCWPRITCTHAVTWQDSSWVGSIPGCQARICSEAAAAAAPKGHPGVGLWFGALLGEDSCCRCGLFLHDAQPTDELALAHCA